MPPAISDIPNASQLQQQLTVLEDAISALNNGSTVTNITVSAPPPSGGNIAMPIPVILNPPISDTATITDLTNALQAQHDSVQQQLVDMGFSTS